MIRGLTGKTVLVKVCKSAVLELRRVIKINIHYFFVECWKTNSATGNLNHLNGHAVVFHPQTQPPKQHARDHITKGYILGVKDLLKFS